MATAAERDKAAKQKKELFEKHLKILDDLLKLPENRECADCGARGPRWASTNLGVFVCIRCSGIHRSLGVHISKVRSVTLDSWLPEQIETMQKIGNAKAKEIYEANVPQSWRNKNLDQDYELERWIRAKYEKKEFFKKPGASENADDQKHSRKERKESEAEERKDRDRKPKEEKAPKAKASAKGSNPLDDLLDLGSALPDASTSAMFGGMPVMGASGTAASAFGGPMPPSPMGSQAALAGQSFPQPIPMPVMTSPNTGMTNVPTPAASPPRTPTATTNAAVNNQIMSLFNTPAQASPVPGMMTQHMGNMGMMNNMQMSPMMQMQPQKPLQMGANPSMGTMGMNPQMNPQMAWNPQVMTPQGMTPQVVMSPQMAQQMNVHGMNARPNPQMGMMAGSNTMQMGAQPQMNYQGQAQMMAAKPQMANVAGAQMMPSMGVQQQQVGGMMMGQQQVAPGINGMQQLQPQMQQQMQPQMQQQMQRQMQPQMQQQMQQQQYPGGMMNQMQQQQYVQQQQRTGAAPSNMNQGYGQNMYGQMQNQGRN
mmetsp:Transcript_6866/g.11783  ORF Transcript_6866/g.11783 Transcript_6866/m.11783 type:complete len:538 (+) Transcript_6866:41-1654(+)